MNLDNLHRLAGWIASGGSGGGVDSSTTIPGLLIVVIGGGILTIVSNYVLNRGNRRVPTPVVPPPFPIADDYERHRADRAESALLRTQHALTYETARAWRYREQLLRHDIEPDDQFGRPGDEPPEPEPPPDPRPPNA